MRDEKEACMNDEITGEDALRAAYPRASEAVYQKELRFLDPHCRSFIALSPFLCIGTSRPDGLADVSPRGGEPGFVHVLDDRHLAMPDRPGNNRLDTLGNLVHAPAVGLLFFIPGIDEMLRVNGVARVVTTPELMARFVVDGKQPRSVLMVEVREAYLHCTKALKRSELWNPEKLVPRSALPSFGQMLKDQMNLPVPAEAIDTMLEEDARTTLY